MLVRLAPRLMSFNAAGLSAEFMVISDKHKYVFVELPRTGSSAISRELREHYDGRNILHKHATYDEFLSSATDRESSYFVFGGLRNPVDDAVSLYFKLVTDHQRKFSRLQHAGWFTRLAYRFRSRQFHFARADKNGFSRFFLKFYRFPYDNWSSLAHARFDRVLRFETLVEDFDAALAQLGIEPVRPLPVGNKTGGRSMAYWEYYNTKAIARARWVFGVYMEKWGYGFPISWKLGEAVPGAVNRLVFRFLNVFRRFYWRRLRPVVYAKIQRDQQRRRALEFVE
ncbi:MAG: hypothetical protein H0W33_00175 [Gammaproteobacteria bacterium]|nr:hypothetical protein [Gammaproteobacteria bacterium]